MDPSRKSLAVSSLLARRAGLVVILAVVSLLAVRLYLPVFLQRAINARLAQIPDYTGRVEAVDVSLLRGAYTMRGLRIEKRNADTARAFFAVDRLDFSLAWRELLHGRVVSEIQAERPNLNFVLAGTPQRSQADLDGRWQDLMHSLFPLEITHLDITGGELHFATPDRAPPVDIFITDLRVKAQGLRNRPDPAGGEFPATLIIDGATPGRGRLALSAQLEPLAVQPHFHLLLKVDDLALPAINQFLLAYGNVDVSSGTFTGYLEMTSRQGRFNGYLKPFFADLVFRSAGDGDRSLFARLWESIVAGLARLGKNDDTQQVALRIPFSGDFSDTSVGLWSSLRTLLRNGFIQALQEGLDGHPRSKAERDRPLGPADLRSVPATPD